MQQTPYDELHANGQVFSIQHARSQAERARASRDLLYCVAVTLARGETLPESARKWMAEALWKAAQAGSADIAFGLKGSPHRRADPQARSTEIVHMHAAICWGLKKEAAAALVCQYFDRPEIASVVKQYNKLAKIVVLDEPNLTDRTELELEWRATPAQLAAGREVWVSYRPKDGLFPSTGIRLDQAFAQHVQKSLVDNSMAD